MQTTEVKEYAVSSAVAGSIVAPRKYSPRITLASFSAGGFQFLFAPIMWFLFRIFTRIEVRGIENLATPNGVILAVNHTSELDGPLVCATLFHARKYLPLFFVAKGKSFYRNSGWRNFFYGGLLFKLIGAMPVRSGHHDYEASLAFFIAALQRNKNVLIFPEGERTKDGKIGEVHGGVAFLSEKTGKSVIPVAVNGLLQMSFLDFILRRRVIGISFGKPLRSGSLISGHHLGDAEKYKSAATVVMEQSGRMLAS
ncbi:MAG: hypothetical protein A2928_00630 [Candidatus Taylorbacteria bacterium RIFCSPLOWO2_01_FULL_45_15b]|uniref:Phospholipid/glycerol acyltransferase domain-containing protein n=1 Tax=Candidatus Taylorbacteria bacterium RIFCSPLOWO2_01_FULL_45_15b TaxID=1802319 RepID=A0A1G2NCA9_9BACT|nr:MAG: hypothetical protein A2928_00630 [Candidatus Taylorbacteria bacterium RIFCSPLOWO2_01_FULL_45_15b]